jgi:hypothetical protein
MLAGRERVQELRQQIRLSIATKTTACKETTRLLALLFLFHGDSNGSNCRKANSVAFHLGNKAAINEVVMALVAPFAAVLFGQLDAAAFNCVDGANVDTIRADDFHVFPDIGH